MDDFIRLHQSLSTPTRRLVKYEGEFGWEDVGPDFKLDGRTRYEDEKKHGELLVTAQKSLNAAIALAKTLFKADHPYRTKLHFVGTLGTSTGTVNFQLACSTINVVQEWVSISALFDEFFLHSLTVKYFPNNRHSTNPTGATLPASTVVSTTATSPACNSAGLAAVCLFSAPAYYSTSAGMMNSPTKKLVMSDAPWSYTWRNNVRFDPHGICILPGGNIGWQSWMYVTATADLGGAIQIRAINDQVMAGGTTSVLGTYVGSYDVSFRVRA